MSDFGKKLKELRGDKSIREASRNIGISHTYLDSLEKGFDPRSGKERKPTIEVIHKIANYYDYNFLNLISLAGLFDSLSDIPENIKKDEIKKLEQRFEEAERNKEIDVKNNYISLISNKLNGNEVFFLEHIYNYFILEKNSNSITLVEGKNIDKLSFIGMLFDQLVESKNSNNKETYFNLKNEFDSFLRQYLDIK
ncbi:helix-turn-helix domain-containing protein [Staphylococcus epidermidis]|uniref:helix-turn-helix domain-containing protein n=1 Tax=Staphylococcus epidermidis TaxID=1282 RepID=UPI001C3C6723|nr:helix-turn-helix transcriptional regulator [Staphylococcus epidermidis]MBV5158135.1 helix-turn-helix domain-containing protein [Staphylococcus epidermidis]MCD9078747.1 helix-turn-helix domain-containing protein [Staphylococcus epidermidis]MEB7331570.1 helix-turn-helix domain-containing protein [Staphylococcus epidermidis]